MHYDSLFLMTRPNFFEGMGRVLDLGDTLTDYNYSPDGNEADHAANWADWELISRDLREAAQLYVRNLRNVEAQSTR